MVGNLKRTIRLIVLLAFILLVSFIPLTLLYVGTKQPGIDLHSSLSGEWTIEPFVRLFTGTKSSEIAFRRGIFLSIIYSLIVAIMSIFFAIFYSIWVSGFRKKMAIGFSFTLLTLVLLPQTYIILPAIVLIQKLSVRPPEHIMIVLILIIGVIPICSWLLFLMSAKKIRELQEMCSLDSLNIFKSVKKILSEIRIEVLSSFLLAFAISWGNFVVPFSLGSKDTYTAIVEVSAFTSHLGKDWAMICAAGVIICIPSILIGGVVGKKLKV